MEDAEMTSEGMEPSAMTLSDYMTLACELQARCRQMTKVKGAQKLERMIGTEIKFFQTLSQKDEATQAAHLQSSNLSHFAAVVHAATYLPGVTRVLRPFTAPDRQHNLLVDVVADQGRSWVKVVARKGQALHLVWAGQGQYGERDMVQQLREYTECARHHPVSFRPPHVHATFYNTLTSPMARVLQEEGVTVWGQVVPVHPDVTHKLKAVRDDEEDEEDEDINVEERGFGQFDDGGDPGEEVEARRTNVDVRVPRLPHGPQARSDVEAASRVVESGAGVVDIRCWEGKVQHGWGGQAKDQLDQWELSDDRTHLAAEARPHSDPVVAVTVKTRTGVEPALGGPHARAPLCPLDARTVETGSDLDSCDLETDSVQEVDESHPPSKAVGGPHASPLDARTVETGSDLDSCDLETDSVQEVDESHPPTQTPPRSYPSTAWTLTQRSHRCVSRILASCPDYSRFVCQGPGPELAPGAHREKVNLDITTLITLVSSVCHGGCHFRFKDKVLDQQAAEERQHPSLPDLQAFLQDKEWIVCRTAWSDFNGIVQLLGGATEQKRAAQLLNRVTIVDDQMSPRASNLQPRGKIKERSKMVFGTGDALQAVTVTANTGFLRAAESQGVSFAVHVHPARALTEQKEFSASPL